LRRYGESKAHEAAKIRIGEILSAQGWKVYVDCYAFECETAKGPRTYWPDIYAESPEYRATPMATPRTQKTRARRIVVEIQGFKAHGSKITKGKDDNRIQDIWESHGFDIEYYPVWLWAIRKAPDATIREELGLT
jgi:hypothetical protein